MRGNSDFLVLSIGENYCVQKKKITNGFEKNNL